jgi:hypothetical protein
MPLLSLDLSFNLLNGTIPKTMNALQNLSALALQHNELTGSIPPLGELTNIGKGPLAVACVY